MPRIPKTLPAQLRQYYRTAPRPAGSYGNDVFNFAADRLGRRNRAVRDLGDLDRYAMEQQARGRYRADELNALARQIEADRMLSEMDWNKYFEPREKAARRAVDEYNRGLDQWLGYQKGYGKLANGMRISDKEFDQMAPYFGDYGGEPGAEEFWRNNASDDPEQLFEDINNLGAYPGGWEPWMESAPYPDYRMDDIVPDDAYAYETPGFLKKRAEAMQEFRDLNYKQPPYFRYFHGDDGGRTSPGSWRKSIEKDRYR